MRIQVEEPLALDADKIMGRGRTTANIHVRMSKCIVPGHIFGFKDLPGYTY